jgi:hypothetical protein
MWLDSNNSNLDEPPTLLFKIQWHRQQHEKRDKFQIVSAIKAAQSLVNNAKFIWMLYSAPSGEHKV